MARYAYVITKWIGNGKEDPYTPEVASEVGYCQDMTNQYIHFNTGLPDPNLLVCKVGETLSPKHDGMIDALKRNNRFLVLEEWEVDIGGLPKPVVPHANDSDVKQFLKAKGVKESFADKVNGEKRTTKMRNLAKTFERKKAMTTLLLP